VHGTNGDDSAEAWLNDPDRAAAILDTAARMSRLLDDTRAEQARRHAAGDEAGARALAPLVLNLVPAVEQTHDLEVLHAIWKITTQHGTGPYPAEDLAALTGHDLATVRRVLADMIANGLATGPPDGPVSGA
jgi:hypothetical protein